MTRPDPMRRLAWPPVLFLVVLFLVPAGLLVCCSFLERDYHGHVNFVYSTEGWELAVDPLSRAVLLRSLLLALGVTTACLLLGYPCATALARMGGRSKRLLTALVTFPLMTSLLLRVYGWMNLLPLSWRGTPWVVAGVMTAGYIPFMVLPLLRAWERLDRNLILASMDLGATPWQTFRLVSLPLMLPGVAAGCALVFIPACGEYLVPHFLGDGKVTVLGITIVQEFMERRNWPYAAASSVWLLALVALPIAVALLGRGAPDARSGEDARA